MTTSDWPLLLFLTIGVGALLLFAHLYPKEDLGPDPDDH